MSRSFAAALLVAALSLPASAAIEALPEYLRPTPTGEIVRPDQPAATAPLTSVALKAARNGYVSFQVLARPAAGPYSVTFEWTKGKGLTADLFREWFHKMRRGNYYPDALVPVNLPYRSQFPEPDNRIDGQKAQAFWVDVWVPKTAAPGAYAGRVVLQSGANTETLPVEITVLPSIVPDEDVIRMDHNSYGTSWFASDYPGLVKKTPGEFYDSDNFYRLIHAYHRIFYEHRGIFHQLGYGHAGKVGPEFAPELAGNGRNRHVADWSRFDRHYGPLFDGTAFSKTRRGPSAIPFVYLPINPEWPASFVNWGEPGYEAEFVNVVSEMERHFREKGWTQTTYELFFNHKKRYKGFPWDGDEVRFQKDDVFFREYRRLLDKAVPAGSPIRILFRVDASWDTERQAKAMAGVLNMWVCGADTLNWLPDTVKLLKSRNEVVWVYGGPPTVQRPSEAISLMALRPWMLGIDGWVHWLTTSAGRDPWFQYEGGDTALVYPGDRFGIDEPIPGIRLKLQRNVLQDLALAQALTKSAGEETVKAGIAQRYNQSKPSDWWMNRPPMADRPVLDLNNGDWGPETMKIARRMRMEIGAGDWKPAHDFILQLAADHTIAEQPMPAPPRPSAPTAAASQPSRDRQGAVIPADVLKAKLDEAARIASTVIDGDICQRITTDRAKEYMVKKDPRDQWIDADNFDVNTESYIQIKKALIRIANLSGAPIDVNLWMPLDNIPNHVQVLIRNAHEMSQFWSFGQLHQPMQPEMKQVLTTGERVTVTKRRGMISVLAPVRNSLGDIVGFVEAVGNITPDPHENVK